MCLAAAVVDGCAGPLRLRAHSFQNAALKLCDANGCRRGYVDGFMPDSTTTSCARVARRFVRVRRRLRRGHGFPLVRQRTRIARAWPSRDRPDGKASLALESCSLTVAALPDPSIAGRSEDPFVYTDSALGPTVQEHRPAAEHERVPGDRNSRRLSSSSYAHLLGVELKECAPENAEGGP